MEHEFRLGDWLVQPHQNQIVHGGEHVRLDPRVMQVLVCLAERAGEVVPQEQIIAKVWEGVFVTDGVLTNAIWELRKALGDDSANPRFIQTVPKKGYRLVAPVSTPEPSRRFILSGILGAVAALVASIGGVLYFWPSPRSSNPSSLPARFSLKLPEGQRLPQNPRPFFALSPDGSRLVYVAEEAGSRERLYLRALDEFEASPLPGTEGALNPFFSADGEWVGFFTNLRLWKIAVAGGNPIPIADALEGFGGTWSEDDTIVFQNTRATGLYRVNSSGGTREIVFPASEPDEIAFWPQFLPGGREILFVLMKGTDYETQIVALSLDTGERRNLLEGHFASYAETGHLLYAVRGSDTLFAVPFDRKRLEIRGKPVPVLENVAMDYVRGAQFALSRNGTLVYVPGRGQGTQERSLVLVDREGNARPLTEVRRNYSDPRFSPDGKRIAFASEDDIWTLDIKSGRSNRLTFHQKSRLPVWSPDGRKVLFWHDPDGLFAIAADGSSGEERLTSSPSLQLAGSWSSGGDIVFEWDQDTQELYALSVHLPREPESLQTPGFGPKLSPDGRWLAYVSGRPLEVFVQRFPDGGGKWQVSSGGGSNPVWSPDGREIFYQVVQQRTRFMVVPIETDPVFSAGSPRLLFEYADVQASGTVGFPNYDVSPDGKTFVVVKRPPPVTEFNVVLNWFEELERRVPSR